ncbi:MAG: 16S rRNA (cytidine(1402)-2'-O)-methyltransferase [Clostridiales bacterium]|nr:16S rRNA (cytidine(1402)-2'-O)-methyltransferase [Clostridiales bacterium]
MARLKVVATPIGNLGDLSPRALEALKTCDLIAAEDTRVTGKLTSVHGIRKPMTSCHRHNEKEKSGGIVERMLLEDLDVCLTSDAGTPGISDPGEELVDACWEAGISVEAVPGPSAIVTALSLSGFNTARFAFYGFLPREDSALDEALTQIHLCGIPIAVLYESPHRVVNLLGHIRSLFPQVRALVCCDLTKKFERLDRGNVSELYEALRERENVEKGEYCIVLELSAVPPAKPQSSQTGKTCAEALTGLMCAGMSFMDASEQLKREGYKRNEIYRAKLQLKQLSEVI